MCLFVITIQSGCGRSTTSLSSVALTIRVGHGVSQRILTLKYVHLSLCLLPVCIGRHLSQFKNSIALDKFRLVNYSAHPYGTPTVLSSYASFYNYDEGAPNGGTTRLI